MASMEELQGQVRDLLSQMRPMQADYDRAIKAWIAHEKTANQAYGALAEKIADGSFGANLESLATLSQYLTADLELMEQARKVALMLKSYGEVRDELRATIHKISSRLTYSLAADLTSADPERNPMQARAKQIVEDQDNDSSMSLAYKEPKADES